MTGLICKIKDWAYDLQEMSYPERTPLLARIGPWQSFEGKV
ncbi:hypothetical protein T4B_8419 [Trichinella pseudospiralis]|uniref:Uncharacterized protein n=1 Tax=Trichinella pseudospiralis TaxID=6337 RepID=A0A0V1GHK7_TRIPS|nr:hypothetical protein T4B_8419 [Trichinella pseudospiralis]